MPLVYLLTKMTSHESSRLELFHHRRLSRLTTPRRAVVVLQFHLDLLDDSYDSHAMTQATRRGPTDRVRVVPGKPMDVSCLHQTRVMEG